MRRLKCNYNILTKNCTYSLSNLGNGMYQMTFLSKLDIYGVINSLIRYLWMLKIFVISVMPFPRFWKMNKFNSFLPTFSKIKQKYFLFTLFKTLISQKVCHFEQQNKIYIIRIKKLEFIQFKWQRLIKYLWSYRFLKSNAPIFSDRRKWFFPI